MTDTSGATPITQNTEGAETVDRGGYLVTLVVLIAAAALALWSLAQPWVSGLTSNGFADRTVEVTGSQLYPVSAAGCWLALACVLAIVASSGRARRVVAAVLVISAAAVLVAPIAFFASTEAELLTEAAEVAARDAVRTSMWLVTGVAGLLILACAAVIWVRGSGWRSLSGRQSNTSTRKESSWELLDRGEDPTA